jgi:hypothetical protein
VRGVIVILAFVLAACATSDAPSEQWTKPGSRNGDLAVQLYVCDHWSRNAEHLRDCMTGHGWKEVASER